MNVFDNLDDKEFASPRPAAHQEPATHKVWGSIGDGISSSTPSSEGGRPQAKVKGDIQFCESGSSSKASSVEERSAGPASASSAVPAERKVLNSGLKGEELYSLSVGSFKHKSGNCIPCAAFERPSGCAKGQNCEFCHVGHDKKGKAPRPRKGQRIQQRERLGKLMHEIAKAPHDFDPDKVVLPAFVERNENLKGRVLSRMQDVAEAAKSLHTVNHASRPDDGQPQLSPDEVARPDLLNATCAAYKFSL